MSYETQPSRRGGPFLWMLAGMAITLAFVGVAAIAYMLGAGIIGAQEPPPTLAPSPLPPPSATPAPDLPPDAELGTSNLYVEYILDASGSMNEPLSDGTLKLAIAQHLLAEHLQAFRPETHIGLRAYGHRVDYRETAESCQDIELIAPVEVGQLPAIVTWLRGFQALGMTPLAESIRQAVGDFVLEPARINSIVMLSDGIETCEGDPCGLVRSLQAEGINFAIHVIGLDVDPPAREQLSCIAHTSGGTYHDARSEQELREALEAIASQVTYEEAIVAPGLDTPTPEPASTRAAQLSATSTLAPTQSPTGTPVPPSPTEQPTEEPPPPEPTVPASPTPAPPTATPPPPTATPTAPARVLPQPILSRYEGQHVNRGITTDFGEDYRASFDQTVGEITTCKEEKARDETRVDVVCRRSYTDPSWTGSPYTTIWDVHSGMLVGREGENIIPSGVGNESATISLAGQEFDIVIQEASYQDKWVSDGNDWWEDTTCKLYEHASGMTVRWICHGDIYTNWEGNTYHIYTHDSDIELTETNLDL